MVDVKALHKALLLKMLRRMLLIRRFEEEVVRLAERGEIVGAAHSYIGVRKPWRGGPASPCEMMTI